MLLFWAAGLGFGVVRCRVQLIKALQDLRFQICTLGVGLRISGLESKMLNLGLGSQPPKRKGLLKVALHGRQSSGVQIPSLVQGFI